MQMPLEPLESEQASLPKIDLSQIAADNPVNQQVAVLDLNTFDATQLTLLEVLDMSEAAGVEPEALGRLMAGRQNTKRMRLLYALAWCIAKRANPLLTFDEVCRWKLDIIGEVDDAKIARNEKRAAIVVNAAAATGLSPTEAGNLTIAELGAYNDRRVKANRAARRRAR
jgi:hypothetical protein